VCTQASGKQLLRECLSGLAAVSPDNLVDHQVELMRVLVEACPGSLLAETTEQATHHLVVDLIRAVEHDTKDLPTGSFWCQIFEGRHLSVDYHYGSPILTVEGFRNPSDPLWKFSKWQKCAEHLFMPIELSLLRKFEYVNIEYIGKRVIEVHLRGNPDFVHGNTVAIPVWNDDDVDQPVSDELRYIDAPDYMRKGFLID
jgi:hypothetical protein